VINIPPKQAGVCDICGGVLYQRADDQEATILNRLDVYTQQTESLISFYDKKGILVRVDSARSRNEAVAEILRVAEPLSFT
jgi:adenylate kinase